MIVESWLFTAFIYLLTAVIFVPLATWLKAGSILGYLFAGIVLEAFLSSETADVMHIAEFGVVMMLFLIGLELEPQALWKRKEQIMGLGTLQVLLTALLITIVILFLGKIFSYNLVWQEALAIGLILALSSTAIVLQTLSEKGWNKSPAGRSAFSVLLFQDIAIIPLLAILPILATHSVGGAVGDTDHHTGESLIAHLPAFWQFIVIIAACLTLAFSARYLLRPIFGLIAKTGLREMFVAFALLLVVGIAVMMQAVGLSPALGAFLAGVMLADSEYRHELEGNIAPFKGLLLGLFFISVGAGLDFSLILESPLTILGLVFGLILLKIFVLLALGGLWRMDVVNLSLFGLILAQSGEFAFVLLAFAQTSFVLESDLVARLIAVVALSMLLTPILVIIYEKFLLPRMERIESREADSIDEDDAEVILAGCGRFGTIIARLLQYSGYKFTILEYQSAQIESLRRYGVKVFYGDATRMDLLEQAGISGAKVLIITLNEMESIERLIREVRTSWPSIKIVTRAIDRDHATKLYRLGADVVIRQYFWSSLTMAREALVILGNHPLTAERQSQLFARYDVETLKEQANKHLAEDEIVQFNKQAHSQIETLLREDHKLSFSDESGD